MPDLVHTFRTPGKVLFGRGAVVRLGEEAHSLGCRRAGVLTDPGVAASPALGRALDALASAGIACALYAGVIPEPPVTSVAPAAEFLRRECCDVVVGLGGGSAMDTAKLAGLMLTNPGNPADYFGIGLVPNAAIPRILVPTTAGTSSELTNIAIFGDASGRLKQGVATDFNYADVALIDPDLTASMPQSVTAATGLDALTHAIECYTSRRASALTDALARESVRVIFAVLPRVYAEPGDLELRARMCEGVLMSGIGFGSAGVGAVHALAYPLGGSYHVPHGVSNAVLLPYVMRFNRPACATRYADLARLCGLAGSVASDDGASTALVDAVAALVRDLGEPACLRDLGLAEAACAGMAPAALQVTRLLINNPREVTLADAEAIYRQAWGSRL